MKYIWVIKIRRSTQCSSERQQPMAYATAAYSKDGTRRACAFLKSLFLFNN